MKRRNTRCRTEVSTQCIALAFSLSDPVDRSHTEHVDAAQCPSIFVELGNASGLVDKKTSEINAGSKLATFSLPGLHFAHPVHEPIRLMNRGALCRYALQFRTIHNKPC